MLLLPIWFRIYNTMKIKAIIKYRLFQNSHFENFYIKMRGIAYYTAQSHV